MQSRNRDGGCAAAVHGWSVEVHAIPFTAHTSGFTRLQATVQGLQTPPLHELAVDRQLHTVAHTRDYNTPAAGMVAHLQHGLAAG